MLPFCVAFAITTNNNPQSQKVLLKLNAVKNQRFEYVNEIEMTNADIGNLHARFGMRYFVSNVSPTEINEDVVITSNSFSGDSLVNTPEFAHTKFAGARISRTLSFTGNILNHGGASLAPIGMPFDLVFAVNPVAVGETWTVPTYCVPEFDRILVTFKLLSLSTEEATISAEMDKRDQIESLIPFRFVVDRKTGRCKSSSGKFRARISGADYEVVFMRTMMPSAK